MRDIIGMMRWGMMGGGICGTDHLPEIGPWGLPFFGPPPPIHERKETGTANGSNPKKYGSNPKKIRKQSEKNNAYF
jgi:hypothetical protein